MATGTPSAPNTTSGSTSGSTSGRQRRLDAIAALLDMALPDVPAADAAGSGSAAVSPRPNAPAPSCPAGYTPLQRAAMVKGSRVARARGDYPQNAALARVGGGLEIERSEFCEALSGHTLPTEELCRLGAEIGLTAKDIKFIEQWSRGYKNPYECGVAAGLDSFDVDRIFFNPNIRLVIQELSTKWGYCQGIIPTKEDMLALAVSDIRSGAAPADLIEKKEDRICKMMGYYPDNGAMGKGSGGIQINFVNPYPPRDAEVIDG